MHTGSIDFNDLNCIDVQILLARKSPESTAAIDIP